MPAGKTEFQESCREKEDSNGTVIKKWCKAGSSVYLFDCVFCKSKTWSATIMDKPHYTHMQLKSNMLRMTNYSGIKGSIL